MRKQTRDRLSFLSLVCFSQNKVWGITNIKYRGLQYEIECCSMFPGQMPVRGGGRSISVPDFGKLL